MKFLALLFATVAVAASTYINTNYIDVRPDGAIVITCENGRQMEIYKRNGLYGQQNIEIEVTGPNTISRKIQIDDNNQVYVHDKYYQGVYDYLYHVFNQYQGKYTEEMYQQLLNQVQTAVFNGKINNQVYDLLQSFYGKSVYGQQLAQYMPYGKYQQQQHYYYPTQSTYGKYQQQYYPTQSTYGKYQKYFPQTWAYGKYFQGNYEQQQTNEQQWLNTILVKLFDNEVLVNYLNKYYGQQYNFEQIFNGQGIFDKQALLELVYNPMFRTIMFEQGFFNEKVLEQILYLTKQGVFSQDLFEQLVNKQYLQNYLIQQQEQGVFNRYFLQQIVNQKYVSPQQIYARDFLVHLVLNPVYRNILIKQGIFNENVMEQFLHVYKTQGICNEVLLQQLINKSVLRTMLVEYGITNEYVLENEIYGLIAFLYNEKTQHYFVNVPEYYQYYQYHPYGQDFVGIDIKKTIIRPSTYGYENSKTQYGNNGQWWFNNLRSYPTQEGFNYFNNQYQQQRYAQAYPFAYQGAYNQYRQYPTVGQQVY